MVGVGIAADIVLIVVAGLCGGMLAHFLRLPTVVGYILAGVAVGPFGFYESAGDLKQIELLAEIGVALLLFSLGLELHFSDLKAVRTVAIFGTPIQLILCGAYGFGLGHFFGLDQASSIWLGAALSLSSTMVVLKTLMSLQLLSTLSSRVMLGMLLVQDLAAIPMMILLPEMGKSGGSQLGTLAYVLFKATVFTVLVVVVGTRLVPKMLRFFSRFLSRELFFLGIAALALGVGYLTHYVGLSFAFGAFVAGMVVSESEYSHQALSDISPLRDLFGLVFFASVGMLFDPRLLVEMPVKLVALTALVVGGKFLIFATITRLFGYRNIVPLAAGLGLAQIGEFSFVLLRLGQSSGGLAPAAYSLILTASIMSMVVTPLLVRLAAPLYALRRRWAPTPVITTKNVPVSGLRDHIIVAGGGRVGRLTGQVLKRMDLPFVIIESLYRHYERVHSVGLPVILGDAGRPVVLEAAGIARARLLIIAAPGRDTVMQIVREVRLVRPSLHIVARAADLDHVEELYENGIFEVVQPEMEASAEMIRQALLHLGRPRGETERIADTIRREWLPSAAAKGPPEEEDLQQS